MGFSVTDSIKIGLPLTYSEDSSLKIEQEMAPEKGLFPETFDKSNNYRECHWQTK